MPGRRKHLFLVLVAGLLIAVSGVPVSAKSTVSELVPEPGDRFFQVSFEDWGGRVIARVDGRQVTEPMLMTYFRTYGVLARGGNDPVKRGLDDFIDRELVVRDVIRRGLDRTPDPERQLKIFYLTALGRDYLENELRNRVRVEGDEVAAGLSSRMQSADFDLLVFPSEKEAIGAQKEIRTFEEFERYAGEHPGMLKKAEDLSPGSGFFHEFDDKVLFQSKTRTLAGYMETGAGAALVAVRSIRERTPEEFEKIVRERRESLVSAKVNILVNDILERHKFSVDRSAVESMAHKDIRGELDSWQRSIGTHEGDRVIGSVQGVDLTYYDLVVWIQKDYKQIYKGISPEALTKYLYTDAQNIFTQVAVGIEAQQNGYALKDSDYLKAFNEFKKVYYNFIGLRDRFSREPAVTDAEAKSFFRENRKTYFLVPESVDAAQIFTKSEGKAKRLASRLKKGEPFEEIAGKETEDEKSKMQGGDIGTIVNAPPVYESIREEIFPKFTKAGAVTGIIKSPAGYHMFKIYKHNKERDLQFKDSRSWIVSRLMQERMKKAEESYHRELRRKYSVQIETGALDEVENLLKGKGKPTGESYH